MSTTTMDTLGEKIKKAIKKKGLTYAFVAKKMGLSRQTIQQVDTRKTFDSEWLENLKQASGLDFTSYYNKETGDKPYLETSESRSQFKEPEEQYGEINMSISFNISAPLEKMEQITEFISFVNHEAVKKGFKLK